MDLQNKESKLKDDSNDRSVSFSENEEYLKSCPQDQEHECSTLNYPCITCDDLSLDCRYGGIYNYSCTVKPKVACNVSNLLNCYYTLRDLVESFNNHLYFIITDSCAKFYVSMISTPTMPHKHYTC